MSLPSQLLGGLPDSLVTSSEFYGRRPIYLVSFTFFLIWLIPEAASKNIATMLVGRFLCGLSGSAFMAVAGGRVEDLFNREQIQTPMVMFTATGFVGPYGRPFDWGAYQPIYLMAMDVLRFDHLVRNRSGLACSSGPGDVPPRSAPEQSPETPQRHWG